MNSRKQIGICNRDITQKTFQFYVPNIWSSLAQSVENATISNPKSYREKSRKAEKGYYKVIEKVTEYDPL